MIRRRPFRKASGALRELAELDGAPLQPADHAVAIVGLGYAGLPLAQGASSVIGRVIGLDVNDSVVSALRAGRSHVDDLDDVDVAAMLDRGFE
ncbi:MAG: hypothetical protein WB967_16225, partial [Mycobacterium sp.]